MRILNALLAVAAAACLLAVQVAAGHPQWWEEARLPCERLPVNVRPTKYDLHLRFSSLDSDVYEGHVDIGVEFTNNKAQTQSVSGLKDTSCAYKVDPNVIVLHADKNVEIDEVEVSSRPSWKFLCGVEMKSRQVVELRRDLQKQLVAIKVKSGLYGEGKISIAFRGRMSQNKRGLYVSTYKEGEQVFKHIVTQFQPTDARTAFPCFDEPRFRAPFSVRLTHPSELTAYGNNAVESLSAGDKLATTLFKTTPTMPLHLVSFIIGRFDAPLSTVATTEFYDAASRQRQKKDVTVSVLTVPGRRQEAEFALEVAKKSLIWFVDYINVPYPLEKLDVIAIADHDKDNQEPWGLVYVRDTLAWVDDDTKGDKKLSAAVNIAHVVTHQWFANMISISWWPDIWITEGVAAHFAFKIVIELFPGDSQLLLRFPKLLPNSKVGAPVGLNQMSPAYTQLVSSEQIYNLQTKYWYVKAGFYSQMVEATVGNDDYRKILQYLVKQRAFQTVDYEWYRRAVLSVQPHDASAVLNTTLTVDRLLRKNTQLPVVQCESVSVDDHLEYKLHLEPASNATEFVSVQLKNIPLVQEDYSAWSVETGDMEADSVPTYRGLPEGKKYFQLDYRPIAATYYSNRFPDLVYDCLQTALEVKFIPAPDRAAILSDANALVQANLITLDRFKSLLDAYADEEDPAALLSILSATSTYKTLAANQSAPMPSNAAIARILQKYGFASDGKESLAMQQARQLALKALVVQGNQEAATSALETFDGYKDEGLDKLALFLREPIYTAVALFGGSRVDQLLGRLAQTKSFEERVRLITALSLSKDKDVLTKLKLWIESSGLKPAVTKPILDAIGKGLSQ